MTPLRLAALDEEDLNIISAHVQDAVFKVADIDYAAAENRLILALNRFAWDAGQGIFRRRSERRRAVLHFDRVRGVKTTGIRRDNADAVLSVLALRFEAGEEPSGTVEITCSGGAAIRLDVECIEARLTDLGAAWQARGRPRHSV